MKKIKIALASYLLVTLTTAPLLCQETPVAEQPALRVHVASLWQRALHPVFDQWYKDSFREATASRLPQTLRESIQQIHRLKDQARRDRHWGITPEQCVTTNRSNDTLHYILWHTREGYKKNSTDAVNRLVALAAEYGNDDCLASLLSHALTPQTLIDPKLLFDAIEANEVETARILLEHGANLSAQDYPLQDTPLHASLRQKRFEITELILKRKPQNNSLQELTLHSAPDLTLVNSSQQLPLHQAVLSAAPYDIIKKLLSLDPTVINTPSFYGQTALHGAAKECDSTIIQLLLQHGAQLESRNDVGRTPFHCAAAHGNSSAVSALLQAGANPTPGKAEVPTVLNGTLLQLAAAKNFWKTQNAQLPESQYEYYAQSIEPLTQTALLLIRECDALFAHPAMITKILQDVGACQSPEIIQALHTRGVDLSLALDEEGNTMLHKAIQDDTPITCAALLAAGVNVNIQNAAGDTPLHSAYQSDNETLIAQLLTAGANPEIRNNAGQKPSALTRKRIFREYDSNTILDVKKKHTDKNE